MPECSNTIVLGETGFLRASPKDCLPGVRTRAGSHPLLAAEMGDRCGLWRMRSAGGDRLWADHPQNRTIQNRTVRTTPIPSRPSCSVQGQAKVELSNWYCPFA